MLIFLGNKKGTQERKMADKEKKNNDIKQDEEQEKKANRK